jgi:hypothetical protein
MTWKVGSWKLARFQSLGRGLREAGSWIISSRAGQM